MTEYKCDESDLYRIYLATQVDLIRTEVLN